MMSQNNEVAAIHSKLDQIIAAYASVNTPRGNTPPPSIFSIASERQMAIGAQLDTADSIMPGGKAAAGWDNAAAEPRAADSAALSPKSRSVDDDARSDSAADDTEPVVPTPKGVKFLLDDVIFGDQDPRTDAEEADTDANAEAPTRAPAPAASTAAAAAATSQKLSKQSPWSRLRSKTASSSSGTSDRQNPAGKPQTDMPAAIETRSSPKVSAFNNGDSAGDSASDSATQDDMAPGPAAAAALSAGPVPSASSMPASGVAADTEVQVAGGKTDTVSVPAAKPRSSLKKMLRRVLH